MILLVTPCERASECAAAIQQATGESVTVTEGLARATILLRMESYLAVVLDQYLLETEPDEAQTALEHLDTAILVQVNLAISGMERLVREVGSAVQRRRREELQARQAAQAMLLGELNGTITPLQLSIELALQTPGLPDTVAQRLHAALTLLEQLRKQLESQPRGKQLHTTATP